MAAAATKFHKALLVRKSVRLGQGGIVQSVRAASTNTPKPWNYLWKPGPYPKTEEEKVAAAKKYGMLREDYEPYPDDGYGNGDYPKMPPSSGASRSGHIWWDDPDLKRNFGEPVHYNIQMTRDVGHDDTTRLRYPHGKAFLIFLAITFAFGAPQILSYEVPFYHPVSEIQRPLMTGKTYYEFPED